MRSPFHSEAETFRFLPLTVAAVAVIALAILFARRPPAAAPEPAG